MSREQSITSNHSTTLTNEVFKVLAVNDLFQRSGFQGKWLVCLLPQVSDTMKLNGPSCACAWEYTEPI